MDPRAVRRHFARAAATYDGAAVLQREVGRRMAERLDVVKLAPAAILDAAKGRRRLSKFSIADCTIRARRFRT